MTGLYILLITLTTYLRVLDNMATSIKAKVTQVKLGLLQIEGLMLRDGEFGIGVSQAGELFAVPQNNRSRDFKRLLGEGFQFLKTSSELNPKQVDVLTLSQFETLMTELALIGNPKAVQLLRALAGTALHKIFCDAFGIRCDSDEMQRQLIIKMERLAARHEWTDVIKRHLISQGCYDSKSQATRDVFKSLTVSINRALFGQDHFNCDRGNMTVKQQRLISSFETMLAVRSGNYPHESPEKLIKTILSVF